VSECNFATCPHIKDLEEEVRITKEDRDAAVSDMAVAKRYVDEAKALREGDNALILALAQDASIKITCAPHMLGLVWEQFHAGVMDMKRRLDRVTACGDCDPCLGGRPDQCAIMGTANKEVSIER